MGEVKPFQNMPGVVAALGKLYGKVDFFKYLLEEEVKGRHMVTMSTTVAISACQMFIENIIEAAKATGVDCDAFSDISTGAHSEMEALAVAHLLAVDLPEGGCPTGGPNGRPGRERR